jgi:hypothetical protein
MVCRPHGDLHGASRVVRHREPVPLVRGGAGHGKLPRQGRGARQGVVPYHGTMGLGKIARYTSAAALVAALVFSFFFVLRERRRPTPLSPRLFFLVENPLTGAFVGAPLLVGRLGLAPGMKVLDAGCGPGRLTVPLAKALGRAAGSSPWTASPPCSASSRGGCGRRA